VAARSKVWVCGRSLAGIAGSNRVGSMGECCVLSGRSVCVGLITRPEGVYRVWCVSECDREASIMRRPWPTGGCCVMGGGIRKDIGISMKRYFALYFTPLKQTGRRESTSI
jgi:hypothetical protein